MAGAANGSGDRAMIVPRLSGRTGHTATVMPGSRSSWPNARCVVAGRREQKLQIGARQSPTRRQNTCALVTPKVSAPRPVATKRTASPASRMPCASWLIDTALLRAVRHARDIVVLQIGADTRQIVHHRHADRLQMLRRPDARDLQQMRRIDRAAAHDHLARRARLAIDAALAEDDPGAAPALEQQARGHRLGLDRRFSRRLASARKVCAVEPRKRPLRVICE